MAEKSKKLCEDAIKYWMKQYPELDREDIEFVMELYPCEGDYVEEEPKFSRKDRPFSNFLKDDDDKKKGKKKPTGLKKILSKIIDKDD